MRGTSNGRIRTDRRQTSAGYEKRKLRQIGPFSGGGVDGAQKRPLLPVSYRRNREQQTKT